MVNPTWPIRGFENYSIGDNNQFYRVERKGAFQLKKLCMKNYSKGYYFSGKFYIHTKLRTLLVKI
jgi:hypothetical protein